MDIQHSDALTGYSIATYIGGCLAAGLTFFDTHAAGIVALATLFTAVVNWRHQRKRTRLLENDRQN